MKLPSGAKHFVLAGLVGIVAVFLVHSYISKRLTKPVTAVGTVVVAEADIAPGTALSGRLLRVASWPGDIIPPKAVTSPQQVEGRVSQGVITKGEPILLTKLAPEGTAAGLGGLLSPDRLAVTVKTDEVTGVAGFINPGDRVDVLAAVQNPGEGSEHQSKLILQNLKVLSKGQIWDQTADKKPQVVQTVTLEVSAEQAEVLNLASFQGRIRLALRNQLNTNNFHTGGVATSQLCNIAPKIQVAAAAPPKQKKQSAKSDGIQMIRGTTVSAVKPLDGQRHSGDPEYEDSGTSHFAAASSTASK